MRKELLSVFFDWCASVPETPTSLESMGDYVMTVQATTGQTGESSWWTSDLKKSKVVLNQRRPAYPVAPETPEEAVRARVWVRAQRALFKSTREFSPGVTEQRICWIEKALEKPEFAEALAAEDLRLAQEPSKQA